MDLLGPIVGGLIGAIIVGFFRSRARRRRPSALAAEQQIAVPSSIRLLTGGLKGRWRQGSVVNRSAGCVWRPRPPRVGRAIPLNVTSVRGRRAVAGLERWWVSGSCDVLQLTGDIGEFELAVPSTERQVVERQLGFAVEDR